MQDRPDQRIAGGGLEGTASEQEGAAALAEDEIRTEQAAGVDGPDQGDRPTAPGTAEESGPLPAEPTDR